MMNLTQFPRWLRDHYLATGLLVLISGFSQLLFAATLVVNSLEDTTLADGQCTLREALDNANQDTAGVGDCIAGSGDDVIDLTGLNGTITLSSELKITSNLVLKGPGAEKLTLSGDDKYHVFWVNSGTTVEIKGMKISNGYDEYHYGSIINWGTLTITDSVLSENKDLGINNDYGGTLTLTDSKISENEGAGIYNNANTLLILVNSTVSGNGRDGIYADHDSPNILIYITNSTVSRNHGGGINIESGDGNSVHITNSTVSENDSIGIAILSADNLTLINSIISENKDVGVIAGGTLTVTDSTISGNSGGDAGGIYGAGTSTITDSMISGNSGRNAGGIGWGGTLTITNSRISGNSGGYGGGIYYDGTLIITNSTISGNSADYGGGGICTLDGDSTSTISNSTISGNSADYGGGIYGSNLIFTNSTVSRNFAKHSGGGIYSDLESTLINSTVSENVSGDNPDDPWDGGGGIYNYDTLNLKNTLIANNTNGDCYNIEGGTINTNFNNFIGDGSCDPTFSGDPKLGPLANNGGPTFTHALRRGSPAIDAGDDATCAAAPVNGLDQRGVARFGTLAGNHCDIGAYEYQKPALATLGSFAIESNVIKWETLAELGTQGFYLWQAEPVVAGTCEAFTNPQLVISKPISAKGSEIQGETYQAAVAVNLNGCYGIQEIPSGQIYITPRPGRNEWTGEQWLTR